jgi:hypothetical protein
LNTGFLHAVTEQGDMPWGRFNRLLIEESYDLGDALNYLYLPISAQGLPALLRRGLPAVIVAGTLG